MQIEFVRSGGFAGLNLSATIDCDALPPDEAQSLKDELDAAQFFSLPTTLAGSWGGADRFQYDITVDDDGRTHSVTVGEAAVPASLQPLIQHLERLAKTQRGT